MPGILYIVATPIGNLEDITYRAVRILNESDLIACEDTRQTRKLLDHYRISKPLVSYHEHNERERTTELIGALEEGKSVALVSDAGTPLIADPGYRVVTAARKAGFAVIPVPGPSAAIAALSASGLATDAFAFYGFLSPKPGARDRVLESIRASAVTCIFYEAPHRILETLERLAALLPERRVVLARELTKVHEEFLSGAASEIHNVLAGRPSIRGEFTVMVGKPEATQETAVPLETAVEEMIAAGVPRMEAYKRAARARGLSKREVYRKMES